MAQRLEPDSDFWRGKCVFLTGHTGFKGAWLALWLHRLGARVCGFALAPDPDQRLFSDARVANCCESVFADIGDASALTAALTASRAEIVLHLAAQSLVQRSYRLPAATYATNVMGTVHILEAMRQTPTVQVAVIVTSDKCYDNREWIWPYREDEPLGGTDPYSSSKACTEIAVAAWRHSFFRDGGPAVATARAGNVIGGGDWAENRLIPDCIRAIGAHRTISVRNPDAVRPWQHVLEPLSGYLMLCEKLWSERSAVAEAWNFGPDAADSRPVRAIVDKITALWGNGAHWDQAAVKGGHEADMLALDSTKARSRLGWTPRLSFDQALAWTVSWYKLQHAGNSADRLVAHDIERYESVGLPRS